MGAPPRSCLAGSQRFLRGSVSSETAKTHPAAPRLHFAVALSPRTCCAPASVCATTCASTARRHCRRRRALRRRGLHQRHPPQRLGTTSRSAALQGRRPRATVKDSGRGFDVAPSTPTRCPTPCSTTAAASLISRLWTRSNCAATEASKCASRKRAVCSPPPRPFDRHRRGRDRRAAPRDAHACHARRDRRGLRRPRLGVPLHLRQPGACRLLEQASDEMLGAEAV